jgi:hypothetical protein
MNYTPQKSKKSLSESRKNKKIFGFFKKEI